MILSNLTVGSPMQEELPYKWGTCNVTPDLERSNLSSQVTW